jgi:hypothetical protein
LLLVQLDGPLLQGLLLGPSVPLMLLLNVLLPLLLYLDLQVFKFLLFFLDLLNFLINYSLGSLELLRVSAYRIEDTAKLFLIR